MKKRRRSRDSHSPVERKNSAKNKKRSRHHSSRRTSDPDRDDDKRTRRSSSHRSQSISSSSEYSSSDEHGSHIESKRDEMDKNVEMRRTSSGKEANPSGKESSELPPREASNSGQAVTAKENNNNTEKLKDSIIALLGEDPNENKSVGPPVHQALVERWTDILTNGLSKDKKEKF